MVGLQIIKKKKTQTWKKDVKTHLWLSCGEIKTEHVGFVMVKKKQRSMCVTAMVCREEKE